MDEATLSIRDETYTRDIVDRLRGREKVILIGHEEVTRMRTSFLEIGCSMQYPQINERDIYAHLNVERPEGVVLDNVDPSSLIKTARDRSVIRAGWAHPALALLQADVPVEVHSQGTVQTYTSKNVAKLEGILQRAKQRKVHPQRKKTYLILEQ